jgi:hypothetical protein
LINIKTGVSFRVEVDNSGSNYTTAISLVGTSSATNVTFNSSSRD